MHDNVRNPSGNIGDDDRNAATARRSAHQLIPAPCTVPQSHWGHLWIHRAHLLDQHRHCTVIQAPFANRTQFDSERGEIEGPMCHSRSRSCARTHSV